MKVSRRSWHYRFYSQMYWGQPKSLCTYFWQVVLAATIWLVGLSAVISCGILLVIGLVRYPTQTMGAVVATVAVCGTLILGLLERQRWRKQGKKQPSLVWE